MKRVAVFLALVVTMFAIGCQENNMTNPITSEKPSGLTSQAKLASDVILLNGEVGLKGVEGVNGSWMLGGRATYTLTPNEQGVQVAITVDGMVKPKYFSGYPSVVAGQSTEVVAGIGNQPVILEREYLFDCGYGEKLLHINFAVSESYIIVDAMWVIPFDFRPTDGK
jgi:hypothetical protein